MAEVLGVVASGIAVGQVAQTLGGVLLSLSRLWREVRDVPETIRHMLEELEVIGQVVDAMETQMASSLEPALGLQCLVVQRCRQAQKELGGLVDDLASDIASSRRRRKLLASVKAVLKKETFQRHEKRLQRSLSLLNSVLNLHVAASIQHQPQLVAAEVTRALVLTNQPKEISDVSSSSFKAADERKQKAPAWASSACIPRPSPRRRVYTRKFLRYLEVSGTEELLDGAGISRSTSYKLRLQPPQWLLKRAWDVRVSMAYAGWTACLRQYVLVPDDSEVFRVAAYGTVEELFKLFSTGVASPFSINTRGDTLLHYALTWRLDLVAPLVRVGLDFFTENKAGFPAHAMSMTWGGDTNVEAVRLMLWHGVYDDYEPGSTCRAESRMWAVLYNPDVFDFYRSAVWPDFYQWPLHYRLQFLEPDMQEFYFRPPDHVVVRRLFRTHGPLRPDDLRQLVPSGKRTVLQQLASNYFFLLALVWYFQWHKHTIPEYRFNYFVSGAWLLVQDTILDLAAVVDPCDLSAPIPSTGHTVLLAGLNTILALLEHGRALDRLFYNHVDFRYQRCNAQVATQSWIARLHAGGVDLQAYGEAESAAFLRSSPSCPFYWSVCDEVCRLTGFTCGPRPEDWTLKWEFVPDVEGFVGAFWACIESRGDDSTASDLLPTMPGSWPMSVKDTEGEKEEE